MPEDGIGLVAHGRRLGTEDVQVVDGEFKPVEPITCACARTTSRPAGHPTGGPSLVEGVAGCRGPDYSGMPESPCSTLPIVRTVPGPEPLLKCAPRLARSIGGR